MSLRAIPTPIWFVVALVPMVVSQIIRLRQTDPAMWVFWDYGLTDILYQAKWEVN